jgi:hypothetical protein
MRELCPGKRKGMLTTKTASQAEMRLSAESLFENPK